MRKGISFSVVGIIALLGVLGITIWSASQLSIGSKYSSTYTEITKEDAAIFKLETVKRVLQDDLIFASRQAALDTAIRGGTLMPATFWYCNGKITPPLPDEVNYALSDTAVNYLRAYVNTSKEKGKLLDINVSIPKYTCVGVYDPGEASCDIKDSSKCEYFWTTATGNSIIEIEDPAYVSDTDKLIAFNDMNRFYWIYYRLYRDTEDGISINLFYRIFDDLCVYGHEYAIKQALNELCNHYEELLDEYVTCDYEILCFNKMSPGTCLNVQCRQPFSEDLCYEPLTESLELSSKKEAQKKKISFQGRTITSGSLRFKIQLTDSKYRIPVSSEELQSLVWNLWGAIEVKYPEECYIVIPPPTTTVPPSPPTPTTIPPGVTTTIQPVTTTTIRPPPPSPPS